jgi:hypothetical protein
LPNAAYFRILRKDSSNNFQNNLTE